MTQGLRPVWPDAWLTPQTRRLSMRRPSRLTLAEHPVTGHAQGRGECALPPVINPSGLRRFDTSRELLSFAADLAAAIVASAGRNLPGSHQYAVLTVPHPSGGARHLLCLRISPRLADVFRNAASNPNEEVYPYKVVQASGTAAAWQWSGVGSPTNGTQVTTRRDHGPPVSALYGQTVHI